MTPRCGSLTSAAPPLTTNTTLSSSLLVTTEPQRSYLVRNTILARGVSRTCPVQLVTKLFLLPQSWVGVNRVMCGVSAASCLNTTKGSHSSRSHIRHKSKTNFVFLFVMVFTSSCVHLQTHDNKEHLAMIERVQGPIPQRMIQRSRYPARAPSHCHKL